MGFHAGWPFPFGVAWAVATVHFRRGVSKHRIGVQERLLFAVAVIPVVLYWTMPPTVDAIE